MTRDEVANFLLDHGWERKGKRVFIKRTEKMLCYRFVMMDKILRLETRVDSICNRWVLYKHGYYGQLSINEKDQIHGLKLWIL